MFFWTQEGVPTLPTLDIKERRGDDLTGTKAADAGEGADLDVWTWINTGNRHGPEAIDSISATMCPSYSPSYQGDIPKKKTALGSEPDPPSSGIKFDWPRDEYEDFAPSSFESDSTWGSHVDCPPSPRFDTAGCPSPQPLHREENQACQQSEETASRLYQTPTCNDSGPLNFGKITSRFPAPSPKGEKRPSLNSTISDSNKNNDNLNNPSNKRPKQDHHPSFLACPFYRRDPPTHQECLRYELRRVKDVKQHIYRRHFHDNNDATYTPRSSPVFNFNPHPHTSEAPAVNQNSSNGSISKQQRRALAQSHNRGDEEQQWRNVWDILFPEDAREAPPRPVPSARVGTYLQEALTLVRGFWHSRSDDILAAAGEGGDAAECQRLEMIMSVVFDHFEASAAHVNYPSTTAAHEMAGSATLSDSTCSSVPCATSASTEEDVQVHGATGPWVAVQGGRRDMKRLEPAAGAPPQASSFSLPLPALAPRLPGTTGGYWPCPVMEGIRARL